ncbi:hypothetical protein D3C85_1939460 [compost metagenome]
MCALRTLHEDGGAAADGFERAGRGVDPADDVLQCFLIEELGLLTFHAISFLYM